MRRTPAIAALLLAAALPAPAAAAIQRCLGADGTTIFTDRPCTALGATPAGTFSPGPDPNAHAPATIGLHGAIGGFAVRGCAATPESLVHGVRDALQARDVNRLANYYHWAGTGSGAATALMDRLERIAGRPLAGVELDYPGQPAWYAPDPADFPAADVAAAAPRPRASAVPVTDPRNAPGPAFLASLRRPVREPAPAPADDDAAPAGDATGAVPPPPVALVPIDAGRDAAPPSPRAPTPRPTGLRVLQASSADDPGSAVARFGLRRNAGCWWIEF